MAAVKTKANAKAKPATKPKRAKPAADGSADVDAFLVASKHPMTPAVVAMRRQILAVDTRITEQVKWNAPSFRTAADYLCTFNLRPDGALLLIFHNPLIPRVASPILDGDFKDRRIASFSSAADAKAKTPEVRRVVAALLKEMDP